MPWPTPQDYNEAIQNPRTSFDDAELAAGRPELTPLGLPRPITGNFASVYRLHAARRDWAVRCFWREFSDMAQRYAAIGGRLSGASLPYTVGFQYAERGIRVRGQWYPILKMEWAEGEQLDRYVENQLGNRAVLESLARDWFDLCVALEAAGIAHGDLQHGNVLVDSGTLRLVDYDGMFVPALAGRGSHETGHINFQHPGRTGADFGSYLDRFSAWSIYVSLSAVAASPDLWTSLNAGDEALLFRRADYVDPETSAVFAALATDPSPRIREIAARFRAFLDVHPSRIDPLQSFERRPPSHPGTSRLDRRLPGRAMLEMIVPEVPGDRDLQPPSPLVPIAGPEWLVGHLPAVHEEPPDFAPAPRGLRFIPPSAALAMVATVAAIPMHLLSWPVTAGADLAIVAGTAGTFLAAYRMDDLVQHADDLLRERRAIARELRALHAEIEAIERDRREVMDRHDYRMMTLQASAEELDRGETDEREACRQHRDSAVERLDGLLQELRERENSDLERALETLQARHIHDYLRHASVRSAALPGVGWQAKLRLYALGVWAAADLSIAKFRAIDSLPDGERLALAAWRIETENAARRTAPQQLTPHTRRAIASRYAASRERHERERKEVQAWWEGEDAAITDDIENERASLKRERDAAGADLKATLAELDRETASVHDEIASLESEMDEIERDLARYRGVTLGRYLARVFRPSS